MKVFKFGGASVSTADRIRNVGNIIKAHEGENLLVVVSAMGKTTNALEAVAEAFYKGSREEALTLFAKIKDAHQAITRELTDREPARFADFFTEVEWLLHDRPVRSFDYYYDQIVCVGELLSTALVSDYLSHAGIANEWIDVRDVIRTDNNFRDAGIDWTYTSTKVDELVRPAFRQTGIVLTQGFIGATDENESTTLGREGSDYTAAVFANLLDAENQTIWKDVRGVMNADPKSYAEAQWIRELNYREVIEMAYYGAQVIHPKTIKPLQNKGIPLYVRSFLDPEAEGTCIHNQPLSQLPPIIVYKHKQVLMEFRTRDFSFIGEGGTASIYRVFATLSYRPNLTQNAAISLLCVVDDHPDKVETLALEAAGAFDVTVTRGLTLLTIRHYEEALLQKLIDGKKILLRQQTQETIQLLMTD